MLEKLLASIGVGSAQVDTQIDNPELAPANYCKGQVLVQGGQSAGYRKNRAGADDSGRRRKAQTANAP